MHRFILSAFSDEISSNFDIQLRVLQESGIDFMDIRGVDGNNISEIPPRAAVEIKGRLDQGGIRVACIGSPLGKIQITDSMEPHLELCKQIFEMAKVLDTRYVRIFSFYIPAGDDPAQWRETVVHRLRQMCDLAERYGLILLHENEKGIYGDVPERCLELFQKVNRPNFRGIFDPANFVQCGVKPYPDAFECLQAYIIHIHIKDALETDDTNVPAGMGDGCIPELLAKLKAEQFSGFLTLEPHLTAFEGLQKLELNLNKRFQTMSGEDGKEKFQVAVHALRRILAEL